MPSLSPGGMLTPAPWPPCAYSVGRSWWVVDKTTLQVHNVTGPCDNQTSQTGKHCEYRVFEELGTLAGSRFSQATAYFQNATETEAPHWEPHNDCPVGHSHCSANRLHRKQAVTRSHLAHSTSEIDYQKA